MSNYIVEAFKAMNLLESEDISLNQEGFDELKGFMDEAGVDPDDEMTDVYDLEAQAEEDLKDSYLGKVVLECSVCHSDIFVDKAEVSVGTDSESLACYDIECPYCMSNEGYTIIGEIAPFNQEVADSLKEPELDESPADDEIPAVDVEGGMDKVDEEDLEESLKESWEYEFEAEYDKIADDPTLSEEEKKEQIKKLCATYSMNEELKGDGIKELYDNNEIRGVNELEGVDELKGVEELHGQKHEAPIDEALESATIETDDQTISVSTGEDGSVSLDATPKEDITFESDALTGVEDEMIAPLSDDSIDKIEAAADANSVEEGEEDINFDELDAEEPVDEFGDFEDFDEESFNGLGESYLRECYENVTGFKTTGATVDGKKLTLEGIIKFDSGNIKETEFVFESIGNGKFEGYNKHISRGKKTYRLDTSVKNNKLVCEALNYNYRSRNELNESVRVYGTIKRK